MKKINLNSILGVACLSVYLLLTACSTNLLQLGYAPQINEFSNQAKTYAYECQGGYHFTASIDNQQAWLFLPERTVTLMHVSAASGMKYSGEQIIFWSKNKEAMLEIKGMLYQGCKNNPAKAIWEHAKLEGVDFRAVGHEPDWVLELIKGERIVFNRPLAAEKLEFDYISPVIDQATRTTHYRIKAKQSSLFVEIKGVSCRDSMSGELFEATVNMIVEGQTYKGCGRALH